MSPTPKKLRDPKLAEFRHAKQRGSIQRNIRRGRLSGWRRQGLDWVTAPALPPAVPTEFEQLVAELGLTPERYAHSTRLRAWVKANHRMRYVPEELLADLGYSLETDEFSFAMPACPGSCHV